jgi:hypothetical protein
MAENRTLLAATADLPPEEHCDSYRNQSNEELYILNKY